MKISIMYFIISLLMAAVNIEAASFDCRKATAKFEKIICSDTELSKLDESLSKAYSKALTRPDIKQQTTISQRQWLKNERNKCKDTKCLKTAYETRINELRFTGSFGIVFNRDSLPKALPANVSVVAKKSEVIEYQNRFVPPNQVEQLPAIEMREEDTDITRSLTMNCDNADYESFQIVSVSLKQTENNLGKPASVKKFTKVKNQSEQETFVVMPGQFAECIFPSGTRVRTKVGEGRGSAYGECGADPEVFLSLWVNERKIVSKLWFAGHCSEDRNPSVSFNILGSDNTVSAQKCHTARQENANSTPESNNSKKDSTEPLSVCIDFPDISKYSKDLLEYPPGGKQALKVGDIELLSGSDPVCNAVHDDLKVDFNAFAKYFDESKSNLPRPEWDETLVELAKELRDCEESVFDFNNDKKLDRVFKCSSENSYMDGTVLLVQPGRSSSELIVSASLIDDTSLYLPFQMGEIRQNIQEYPPFSEKYSEAGPSMNVRGEKETVNFRGRYSTVSPFSFHDTNYVAISSITEDTEDYVAVFKPLPNGKFQNMCLIRRIPENF